MTVLETRALKKSFGPVEVLHDISFTLERGEVHALLGENGAGKSTLMKILGGYLPPSSGTLHAFGETVSFRKSADAEARGIVLIHQEMNLAEDLTVEENIFLGRELHTGPFVRRGAMAARANEILASLQTPLNPRTLVRKLSVSQKQMVEIAKAISREVRILIMDEPTDVLTGSETEVLFSLIRRLQADGVTVVFISHKLDEVKRISDRVTVLRDGELITTQATANLSTDEMANLMVGRELRDMYPPKGEVGSDVIFAAQGVTVPGWAEDVSFELHRGEILGFAGLVGAGRTELFEGVLGLRKRTGGTVLRHGRPIKLWHAGAAKGQGIAYLSEDRKGKGLLTEMRLRPNVTLAALENYATPFLNRRKENRTLARAIDEFEVKTPSFNALANTLSGGNQQKVVLAKIMETSPEVLILDEPTRGIDVGTKRELYFFMQTLAAAGKGIILISSEMPELIGLSHRVVVMRSGQVTGVLSGADIREGEIVRYATGLKGKGAYAEV